MLPYSEFCTDGLMMFKWPKHVVINIIYCCVDWNQKLFCCLLGLLRPSSWRLMIMMMMRTVLNMAVSTSVLQNLGRVLTDWRTVSVWGTFVLRGRWQANVRERGVKIHRRRWYLAPAWNLGWYIHYMGALGSAVGWGTTLQVWRSRVWFPMVWLGFFIDIILPAALWPWGWLSL